MTSSSQRRKVSSTDFPSAILASVRIISLGLPTASIRGPVEKGISVLKESGLSCKVNPTCTEMCGSWNDITSAVKNAVDTLLEDDDTMRVVCDIHFDVKKFSRTVVPGYCEFQTETDSDDQNGVRT